METKMIKYWPHVKVEGEYVGSFALSDGGYDAYDKPDESFVLVHKGIPSTYSPACLRYIPQAHDLIAAHRARTPAPSAPAAMSREERQAIVEKVLDAGYDAKYGKGNWNRYSGQRGRELSQIEAGLVAANLIPPAPPPPPQKSANERIADGMVKLIHDGMEVQFTHPADRGRIVLLRHINEANEHAVTLMREYITAALDARDEEHRTQMRGELEALREAIKRTVLPYVKTSIEQRASEEIDVLPLTKSERSAAK